MTPRRNFLPTWAWAWRDFPSAVAPPTSRACAPRRGRRALAAALAAPLTAAASAPLLVWVRYHDAGMTMTLTTGLQGAVRGAASRVRGGGQRSACEAAPRFRASLSCLTPTPPFRASLSCFALVPHSRASLSCLALLPHARASLPCLALLPHSRATLPCIALAPHLRASLPCPTLMPRSLASFFRLTPWPRSRAAQRLPDQLPGTLRVVGVRDVMPYSRVSLCYPPFLVLHATRTLYHADV
jgi:hypothetical protein